MKTIIASTLCLLSKSVHSGYVDSEEDSRAITNMVAQSCHGGEQCESLVEELQVIDDENELFLSSDGIEGKALDNKSNIQSKRLKQLKSLILWLQPEHRFARYCYYGCYCLPDRNHALTTAGYGTPVDPIDGACKRQSECYKCAEMDNNEDKCEPSTTSYKYRLIYDDNDPDNHMKKSIECMDQPRKLGMGRLGCKRAICECDKKLAEDLRLQYSTWNINYHSEQGEFDNSVCIPRCNKDNCHREIECCGYKGEGVRMPFNPLQRSCCGDTTYDPTFFECCEGDRVDTIGSC